MSYGQIVLANTKKGIEAKIFRTIIGGYTHSLITIPQLVGVPMCMEAAVSGVNALRFDTNYLQNPDQEIEIWEVNVSEEMKNAGIRAAINKLENHYGFLELPWFIWRWLNSLVGRDIKHQDNWSKNGVICSELCQLYLTNCGLGFLFEGYGIDAIHPGDLKKIMEANPKYFTKIYSNFNGVIFQASGQS
jgi:hypothetical protein